MALPATQGTGPATELSASDRTDLLHRMLVLRHLAVLSRAPGRGAEAVVAGIGAALSPSDHLHVIGSSPTGEERSQSTAGITVRLAHFGGNGGPDRICALFAHRSSDRIQRQVTVDGWDVEAVFAASARAARAVRTWDAAHLLTLRTGGARGRHDPIAVLADRMRLAHQLDDDTFACFELDARRVATRLSRDRGLDGRLATLATVASALAPRFTPAPDPAARQYRRG
ncbi:hypothetical protein BJY16_006229 [Actinoplanes octamycinicus]|uniref:Uncharacterized protein n=1 Tax=Actinoplanes octamycinicus TaxID=135948 RepID=A0A7W7MAF2_9ACTN|nr:hypothetical protein [Actinoplanes octamycinicus]MBB4742770.1 hypothetical protein [Actinoplanes octamycinicus]GIE58375.1 hypothetical protein Aoc01nite_37770 [Actinoplanes octamycinicus]